MPAPRTARAPARVDALLAELHAASEGLVRLAGQLDEPPELVAARAVIRDAGDTIASQQEALVELIRTIEAMGRQLVESHAKFAEWMVQQGDRCDPQPG